MRTFLPWQSSNVGSFSDGCIKWLTDEKRKSEYLPRRQYLYSPRSNFSCYYWESKSWSFYLQYLQKWVIHRDDWNTMIDPIKEPVDFPFRFSNKHEDIFRFIVYCLSLNDEFRNICFSLWKHPSHHELSVFDCETNHGSCHNTSWC